MPGASLSARIRERYGLRCSLEELVPTWEFADLIFAWGSHAALGKFGKFEMELRHGLRRYLPITAFGSQSAISGRTISSPISISIA